MQAAVSRAASADRRQVAWSIGILSIVLGGLFTYKGVGAFSAVREASGAGLIATRANALLAPTASRLEVVARTADYLLIIGPALVFGILVSGAVRAFVSPAWVARAFSRKPVTQHVVAGLAGAPLMLCSCCVAPVFAAVYERSRRLGPALAVALASPALNPAALVLTFMLFRAPLAIVRLLAGLAIVFAVPPVAARASRDICLVPTDSDATAGSSGTPSVLGRFLLSCVHITARTLPGIAAGILMSVWLAQRFPLDALDAGPFGVPMLVVVASVLAVPVALPTFFEIPLALTLLGAGAPAGVAVVVLCAGPATNLPSLMTIARATHWRVAAFVGLAVAAIACIGGLLVG